MYAALGTFLAIGGCQRGDPAGRFPLSGTVTLGGVPLDEGVIQFLPEQPDGLRTGDLIVAGNYDIPAHQGLTPGNYLVTITAADKQGAAVPQEAPGPTMMVSPERIPAKYNRQSELRAKVTADGPNRFDYHMTPP